jgi:hypothetical protein
MANRGWSGEPEAGGAGGVGAERGCPREKRSQISRAQLADIAGDYSGAEPSPWSERAEQISHPR